MCICVMAGTAMQGWQTGHTILPPVAIEELDGAVLPKATVKLYNIAPSAHLRED